MKKLVIFIAAVILSGCAGQQLQNDWKDKRGYSEEESSAIMAQFKEYNSQMALAQVSSNAFNSAPVTETRARLHKIFCSCVKKMGDNCRKKEGAKVDKSLWVKANAVDMALVGTSMTFETNGMSTIDPSECD